MKEILLIGLGRYGQNIAAKLNELGHAVMAVDKDEKRVNQVLDIVTNAQIGDCVDPEYLASLGVANFDYVIVAIAGDFESSLITTAMAKELGAKKVISRACSDIQEKLLKRNGADQVVYPEKLVGHWTAYRYASDSVMDYFDLTDGFSIYEVSVPEHWVGKTVVEMDVRNKYHLNILAIRSNGHLDMSLGTCRILEKNQSLLVLGKDEDVRKCFKV